VFPDLPIVLEWSSKEGSLANGAVHGGGCLCGEVRYEVSGRPEDSTICHCASCRRAAGAQAVAWLRLPLGDLSFVAGEPVEYRSSARVIRTHCGACGTSLTYRHEDDPGSVDVTTASLDSPEAFPPTLHTWFEERLAWVNVEDGLGRVKGDGTRV
jgi:hypothetical protein